MLKTKDEKRIIQKNPASEQNFIDYLENQKYIANMIPKHPLTEQKI